MVVGCADLLRYAICYCYQTRNNRPRSSWFYWSLWHVVDVFILICQFGSIVMWLSYGGGEARGGEWHVLDEMLTQILDFLGKSRLPWKTSLFRGLMKSYAVFSNKCTVNRELHQNTHNTPQANIERPIKRAFPQTKHSSISSSSLYFPNSVIYISQQTQILKFMPLTCR